MAHNALKEWFDNNRDITQLVVGIFDYNGVLRGKRMPIGKLQSLMENGFKMPLSIIQTDIWGRDIEGSSLLFETGDADGHISLIDRTPLRLSWMAEPTALLTGCFVGGDEAPHDLCPRGRLAMLQRHFSSMGRRLYAGVEMEFHLLSEAGPMPAESLSTGQISPSGDTLSAHQLDDYDALFTAINQLCESQGIEIDTITSELGRGQYEITFAPKDDMVTLADDILIFKYLVKGLAKSYGIRASFMAKPIAGEAGNGLHVHASMLHQHRQNLFHDEEEDGPLLLQQAVAGILQVMKESSLVLAPHMNSYRRLVPSSHAPTKICWGKDNRSASVRIPASSPKMRRLEYRSAGADCQPYLLLSVLSYAIAIGIEAALTPPEPVVGNAYDHDYDSLPVEMAEAISLFEDSVAMRAALGEALHKTYIATKKQEWTRFAEHVSRFEYDSLSHNL
ncbi:MAG: glutamine synthetase family protein [Candidatus Puniceispirillaceae bacterium]